MSSALMPARWRRRLRLHRDVSCPCCRAPVAEVVVIPQLAGQQQQEELPPPGVPQPLTPARSPPTLQQVRRPGKLCCRAARGALRRSLCSMRRRRLSPALPLPAFPRYAP
jgi:hypothetical protein